MAITISSVKVRSKHDYTVTVTNVNLGTYATGGVSVTPQDLGLERVDHTIITIKSVAGSTASQAVQFEYNQTTQKIISYTSENAETTNATNLSNLTLTVRAFMFR